MRILLSLLFSINVSAQVTVPVAPAATPDPELQKVSAELVKNRESIKDSDQEKRKILGSLYEISKRMKKITQEKGQMTDRLMRTQGSVKYIAKDIATLEKKIESQQKELKLSLRNLYKMSGESYVAVLFSQDDAVSLDRAMKFLKIISEKDFALIKLYEQNIADMKSKKSNLNAQVKKLIHLESDIRKQETLLVSEHSEKSKIISQIEQNKLVNVEKIKTLRTKAQEKKMTGVDAALSDLLRTAFYENKGQLPSPVSGRVTQDFGLSKHETYPIEFSHKGWLYATDKNAPVVAIYDGKVSFCAKIDGYGETVIVDHGDHYYTVYSHLRQVKVKRDDLVKKSQSIAIAGSTSNANDVGIYFEIRHFSEPENPKNWISPQDVKVSVVE